MGTIKIIFLHCQNCTVDTIIVIIIIIPFIFDIDTLGILSYAMSRQLTCEANL